MCFFLRNFNEALLDLFRHDESPNCCKPKLDKTACVPNEDSHLFFCCIETAWVFKLMETQKQQGSETCGCTISVRGKWRNLRITVWVLCVMDGTLIPESFVCGPNPTIATFEMAAFCFLNNTNLSRNLLRQERESNLEDRAWSNDEFWMKSAPLRESNTMQWQHFWREGFQQKSAAEIRKRHEFWRMMQSRF